MSSCEHKDSVNVFEQSAVCLDCGEPICRNCRMADCRVVYWSTMLSTNEWQGRALSREDAVMTYRSSVLLCRYRAGKPLYGPA